MALNEQRRVSAELQRSKKELEEYARTLEETIGITPHKGKMVSKNHFCPGLKQPCGFLSLLGLSWMPSVS